MESHSFVRLGNNKGEALRRLISKRKIVALHGPEGEEESEEGDTMLGASKALRGLRGVLGLNSKTATPSVLYNFHDT